MPITLVYPADYFKPLQVDENYRLEAEGFTAAGVAVCTWDGQQLRPAPPVGSRLLYRGWMLTGAQYTDMYTRWASQGWILKTSPEYYQLCHYLPHWYHSLQTYTPETHFIEAGAEALEVLKVCLSNRLNEGWPAAFLKDAVKSLKTSLGSRIDSEAALQPWLQEMKRLRPLEWPLCLRRWEDWQSDTERRYFVYQGQVLAPSASTESLPEPVLAAASCIDSPFFSVDVIQNTQGHWRLVELGDGQVSDTVGWNIDHFVKNLCEVGINP